VSQATYSQEEFQQLLEALFVEKKKIKELRIKVQELGKERADLRQRINELESSSQVQDPILYAHKTADQQAPIPSSSSGANTVEVDSSHLDQKVQDLQEKVHFAENQIQEDRKERDRYWLQIVSLHELLETKETAWHELQKKVEATKEQYDQLQQLYTSQKNELLSSIEENHRLKEKFLFQLEQQKRIDELKLMIGYQAVYQLDPTNDHLFSRLTKPIHSSTESATKISNCIQTALASLSELSFGPFQVMELFQRLFNSSKNQAHLQKQIYRQDELLAHLHHRMQQIKNLLLLAARDQEVSQEALQEQAKQEHSLLQQALELEKSQGEELRTRLNNTLSDFQKTFQEVQTLKHRMILQEEDQGDTQSEDLQVHTTQRQAQLRKAISMLTEYQRKLTELEEQLQIREIEEKLLLDRYDDAQQANAVLLKILEEHRSQRYIAQELLEQTKIREEQQKQDFQKIVNHLGRKLHLWHRIGDAVYVQLQQRLSNQLSVFQESNSKIRHALAVVTQAHRDVDHIEKSNTILYDLLQRYQGLLSRIGSKNGTVQSEIQKVETENARIEARFSRLFEITRSLKGKYQTALAEQKRYHDLATEQKSLAINALIRLNNANTDLKSLSSQLSDCTFAKEKLLIEYESERVRVQCLTDELNATNNLLDNAKKELFEMETIMEEKIKKTDNIEMTLEEIQNRLVEKANLCQELNERLALYEKENHDLKEQELSLKQALKKFYYESKRHKADSDKELQEKGQALAAFQEEHIQIKNKMLELQESLQLAQNQLTDAYTDLEKSKGEYYKLQEQSNYWKMQGEESSRNIKHLEAEMEKILQSFAETKGQLKAALSQQRTLEQERSELHHREQVSKAELSHTRRQLEVLKAGLGQQDPAQWQKRLQELQELAGVLERENESLLATKHIQDADLKSAKSSVELLQNELEAKCSELEELKALHEGQVKKGLFQTEAEALLKQKLSMAETESQENLQKLESLEKELAQTIEERNKAQRQSTATAQELEKLQGQWHSLQEQLSSATESKSDKVQEIQKANETLSQDLCSAQVENARLIEELSLLQQQCSALQEAVDQRALEGSSSKEEVVRAYKELESLTQNMNQARQQLEEQSRRIKILEEENAHLKEIEAKQEELLINAQKTISGKQAQIIELQQKLEESHQQSLLLKDNITTAKIEVQRDRHDQGDLVKELTSLKESLEEKESAYAALKTEYHSLKSQLIDQEFSFTGKDETLLALQERLKEVEAKYDLQTQQIIQSKAIRQQLEESSQNARKKAQISEESLNKATIELEEIQLQYHQMKQQLESTLLDMNHLQDLKDQAMEMLEHTQGALNQAKVAQEHWKKEKQLWSSLGTYDECSKFYERALIAEGQLKDLTSAHTALDERFQYLKQRLDLQEKDLFETRKDLSSIRSQLDAEKEAHATTKENYLIIKETHENLEEDHRKLTSTLSSLEQQLFEHSLKIKEQESTTAKLNEVLELKEFSLQQLHQQHATLQARLSEESSNRKELHGQHTQLQSEHSKLQGFLKEKTEEIHELQLEIQEVKHLLAEGAREAKEIEHLYLVAMKDKAEALAKLQQTSDLLAQAKAQNQQISAELDRAQLVQTQNNSKIEELENTLRKAAEERSLGQQKISLLENKISSLAKESKEQQDAKADLERLLRTEQANVKSHEGQIQNLLYEIEQHQQKFKAEHLFKEQEIASLQEKLNVAAIQLEEKERLQKSCIALTNEITQAKAAIDQAQAAKVRAIESQQRLEQEFQQHKQMLAKKLKENALLFEAIEKHKAQAREFHQLNSQAQLDIEAAKMQKEQLIRQIEQDRQERDEELRKIQQESHEWNQKYRYAQAEIARYTAHIESLEKMKHDYQKMRHAFSNLNQFMSSGDNPTVPSHEVSTPVSVSKTATTQRFPAPEEDGIDSASDLFSKRSTLPSQPRKNLFE
jgi:chromosome segregation ATPase